MPIISTTDVGIIVVNMGGILFAYQSGWLMPMLALSCRFRLWTCWRENNNVGKGGGGYVWVGGYMWIVGLLRGGAMRLLPNGYGLELLAIDWDDVVAGYVCWRGLAIVSRG